MADIASIPSRNELAKLKFEPDEQFDKKYPRVLKKMGADFQKISGGGGPAEEGVLE